MRTQLIRTTIAAAAVTTMVIPAAQAAPVVFSPSESMPTDVGVFGGYVAWTSNDAATDRSRLMISRGGEPGEAQTVRGGLGALSPRLDVGPGLKGAVYAAFPRGGAAALVDMETGATRTTGGSRAVNGPVAVHGDRLAYVAGANRRELRVEAFGGGKVVQVVRADVQSLDLSATHVAYVTRTPSGEGSSWQMHLRNLRTGRDQVLSTQSFGGASWGQITKPSFTTDGTQIVWAETRTGAPGNRVVRYKLRSGLFEQAPGSRRYGATGWAGGKLGLVYSTSMDPVAAPECVEDTGEAPTKEQLAKSMCRVASTGPLKFTRVR